MSETPSDGPQQPKRARQRKILFVLSGLVGVLIVVAVIVVVTRPSPATTARPPAPTPRGILNLVSWWNQNHKPVPVTECIREGETPFGTERAWELGTAPELAVATDDIRDYAIGLRATLLDHPGVLPLAATRPAVTPNTLQAVEREPGQFDAERFPLLAEAARTGAGVDDEDRFYLAVDAFCWGLAR